MPDTADLAVCGDGKDGQGKDAFPFILEPVIHTIQGFSVLGSGPFVKSDVSSLSSLRRCSINYFLLQTTDG